MQKMLKRAARVLAAVLFCLGALPLTSTQAVSDYRASRNAHRLVMIDPPATPAERKRLTNELGNILSDLTRICPDVNYSEVAAEKLSEIYFDLIDLEIDESIVEMVGSLGDLSRNVFSNYELPEDMTCWALWTTYMEMRRSGDDRATAISAVAGAIDNKFQHIKDIPVEIEPSATLSRGRGQQGRRHRDRPACPGRRPPMRFDLRDSPVRQDRGVLTDLRRLEPQVQGREEGRRLEGNKKASHIACRNA